MAEYIERDKALEKAFSTGLCDAQGNMYGAGDVVLADEIKDISASDVALVVHGRWIRYPDCGVTRCSNCYWNIEECFYSRYCPNCGAKMDLSDGET